MICETCKTSLNENHLFCPECGSAFKYRIQPIGIIRKDNKVTAGNKSETVPFLIYCALPSSLIGISLYFIANGLNLL